MISVLQIGVLALGCLVSLRAQTSSQANVDSNPWPRPAPAPTPGPPNAATKISAVWANEGGDKVSQDELRSSRGIENLTGHVKNRVWDGGRIRLSGARNESVSFNLVLEAATADAANVSVNFDTLAGPNGALIQTTSHRGGNDIFDWVVGRPIELFYMRYLQIQGVSSFGWYRGDERQLPVRFRRPWIGSGQGLGGWSDRPDHDKFYPDILVPLELVPTFAIRAGQNQSIWADIYIPQTTPPGIYSGTVVVNENGSVTHSIPVTLTVQPFSLPDSPSIKAFSNLDATELAWRYVTGAGGYVGWGTTQGQRIRHISDVYYQFLHRHRIDLIAGETETPPVTGIHPFFVPRYTGDLFTPARGYDGPGVGVGTSLYAVGSYGSWGRNIFNEVGMWNYADPIASWFHANLPNLPFFLYLQDEPPPGDWSRVENWARWLAEDPGPGRAMSSMATVSVGVAGQFLPHLQIPVTSNMMGECPAYSPNNCDNTGFTAGAVAQLLGKPNTHLWEYGGSHPGAGTTNTEDDGIAMRTFAWVQAKLGIERWFSWYLNLNTQADWFQSACTWGCDSHADGVWGQLSSDGYTNGNGVLVYPGSDVTNTQDSYGVDGPFASLRLKEWRRGIQDGDYLAIARTIDPAAVSAIINRVMPKALWENHAPGWPNGDPSYFYGNVSWSSDPDDWEEARAQLAGIIANACQANSGASYCH